MPDIIKERLEIIMEHASTISERAAVILQPDDFINTSSGKILLDSIITRLQALGENIKTIQKIDANFFFNSTGIDATPIIRFRDLASHHYESINHEIIFAICKTEVPNLKQKIEIYLRTVG